ncbi:MAG: KH domain-containing protein [Myxococcales bacterium]|nr:KH domain-containing protein [Myxococcales bacterium]
MPELRSEGWVDVRGLVEAIVKALVDTPEQVVVTEVEGTHSCVLELSVARTDVGKVIGKRGIHADAIRRIVHAVGGKNRKRYVLEILEER